MPASEISIGNGTDIRPGYDSAVQRFCDAADGHTVMPDEHLSMATEVYLNGGKDASIYGVQGFAYCKYCLESAVQCQSENPPHLSRNS